MTKPTPKEFALAQIAPYLKDPSTCGFDKEKDRCVYLAENGTMCIAGKNLLESVRDEYSYKNENKDVNVGITSIINNKKGQANTFIPESVDILTNSEWKLLQFIHDYLTRQDFSEVKKNILELNLFTLEELEEFSGATLNTVSLK